MLKCGFEPQTFGS